MKRWSLFEILVGVLVVIGLGVAIYYMLTFHSTAPGHQWQPHEVIAVAVVIAAYLVSSAIKEMASAVKEIARAIRTGKDRDF